MALRADSAIEYAVLTKDGYEASLRGIADQVSRMRIDFLKAQPMFSKMTDGKVQNMFQSMRKLKFTHG